MRCDAGHRGSAAAGDAAPVRARHRTARRAGRQGELAHDDRLEAQSRSR